jgi:hypothetical protein
MKNNNISFGCINTKTGVFQEGCVENNEIKFKKVPWYKRIFAKEPTQEIFIKVIEMEEQLIWTNKKNSFYASLYKIVNPLTNEIKKVFAKTYLGNVYFDPKVYEKNKKLIQISE